MTVKIEAACPSDCKAMLLLLPRLASFDVPNNRNPKQLWGDDAKMLQAWAANENQNRLVNVAKNDNGEILGMTMVTLQPELLSHGVSAHLEVLVVAATAEGRGVGKILLDAAEAGAQERGAESMSLHVFSNNTRAKKMYERAGYDTELIRCIKPFSDNALS